ncbi:hypothetical protein HKX48_008235 [Thoreauomyces humboldtii]|nr:hypothetical protein HKX48_008235 [Thoreauomyces humboldtii]
MSLAEKLKGLEAALGNPKVKVRRYRPTPVPGRANADPSPVQNSGPLLSRILSGALRILFVVAIGTTLLLAISYIVPESPLKVARHPDPTPFVRAGQTDALAVAPGGGNGVALNASKVAMLVEPRVSASFVPILLHYIATVPPDWPFHIFTSPTADAHLRAARSLRPYFASGRLRTTMLPANVILKDWETISKFLGSHWIWNQIEAEHVFFFQLDSMICSNSDQTIDDYLHYDYIGAPWPHLPDDIGGNGGFSMRKRSKLLQCLDKHTWQDGDWPEDVMFSRCLRNLPGAVMPTYNQSMEFAIEGQDSKRYIGIHKPWNGVRVADHYDQCPEAAMLFLP